MSPKQSRLQQQVIIIVVDCKFPYVINTAEQCCGILNCQILNVKLVKQEYPLGVCFMQQIPVLSECVGRKTKIHSCQKHQVPDKGSQAVTFQ